LFDRRRPEPVAGSDLAPGAPGVPAERTPTAGQQAQTLLLVTRDGGDGGALGRIIQAASGGPVLHRRPRAVADREIESAALIVVLLPRLDAEEFVATLEDRPLVRVVAVPWGTAPAHLAGAIARSATLPEALLLVGRDSAMRRYSLGVEAFFQASHAVQLGNQPGPAHAHSWHVRVRFSAGETAAGQVLVDFAAARTLLAEETDLLEGCHLNNLPPFDLADCQPTVENVVAVFFDRLEARARKLGLRVEEVTLWENPTSYATCERAA
jgi:6-pyruvoyltetrahydropterin/6-carboxytetrahydropterin synthase